MAKVIILGSSNSIASENHENTHMVVVGEERVMLIDCVSQPVLRLKRAGIDFNDLTDLVLTHFHPDHVSGVPLLLMDMWLRGRKRALEIYGLPETLERVKNLMDAYGWVNWPHFFPVNFNRLPDDEMTSVLSSSDFDVFASPVQHLVPTIGLRINFTISDKSLAYSCDTSPCDSVVQLAKDANILIHEATGELLGHTSAAQAAEIATKANAASLYLIHYGTGEFAEDDLIDQARPHFAGEIVLAEDFMTIEM